MKQFIMKYLNEYMTGFYLPTLRLTDILEIIKRNREARGWSEYQLAEKSGIGHGMPPSLLSFFAYFTLISCCIIMPHIV